MFRAQTYLGVSPELQFKSTLAAVCTWHTRDVTWIADVLGRWPPAWLGAGGHVHAERLKARGDVQSAGEELKEEFGHHLPHLKGGYEKEARLLL